MKESRKAEIGAHHQSGPCGDYFIWLNRWAGLSQVITNPPVLGWWKETGILKHSTPFLVSHVMTCTVALDPSQSCSLVVDMYLSPPLKASSPATNISMKSLLGYKPTTSFTYFYG